MVVITGISFSVPKRLSSAFFCYSDPAAGSFSVPAYAKNSMAGRSFGFPAIVTFGYLGIHSVRNVALVPLVSTYTASRF